MGASHTETKKVKAGHSNKVVTTDIWGEFDALMEAEKLQPGEVTIRMYFDKYPVTYSQAEGALFRMKQAGKLKSRMAVVDGRHVLAYSKV
jgi:hypothetical protein